MIICLYRVTVRAIKRITGDLSTLPQKVRTDEKYKPVLRFSPKFFDLVVSFKKKVRPQILEMLEQVKMEKKWLIVKLNNLTYHQFHKYNPHRYCNIHHQLDF